MLQLQFRIILLKIKIFESYSIFFMISIHTMWIEKLSLWSLRSNPHPPGSLNSPIELKTLVLDYHICIHFAIHPPPPRRYSTRENPFIKLNSLLPPPTVFPVADSGSDRRLSAPSMCILTRSKTLQDKIVFPSTLPPPFCYQHG